jgi:phosphoribosylaminoimidazolecarboxamide formyltransferase/IMP cyclohydrolase
MNKDRPIKRALISVFDKTGIVQFATFLQKAGVEIVSTGGTAKALKDAGLSVVELSDYTGYPEMLSGRVKTLHPKIHGGLLYIRGNKEHEETIQKHGIGAIDMVVVNLYPFEKVVAKADATIDEIIENIDIGGPSMIRSASKNYASVAVIVDPADYESIINEIKTKGGITAERRKELAGKAFARTAAYDSAIARYFNDGRAESKVIDTPEVFAMRAPRVQALRYGENPHQKAALYGAWHDYYKQLQGKELSYNNILDLTAAAELIAEFKDDQSTIAILKHTNPCGVGQGTSLRVAWEKAFATDTQAPFGGIIASNKELDRETAEAIKEIFCEVIVAPSFSQDALKILSEKQNLRLMRILKDPRNPTGESWRIRSVGAESFVVQEADMKSLTAADFRIVTKRQPTANELRAMLFAWRVVKHVKSNAIVYAGEDRTLGVGAGQMSRVDSSRIAIRKAEDAGLNLGGSVIASDAFFPFSDGLIAAAEAGASACIQPGGSIKDTEVIAAAEARGMTMAFAGIRHFRH